MPDRAKDDILVLDDDEARAQAVSGYFAGKGLKVATARDWDEAGGMYGGRLPAVVADLCPDREHGLDALRKAKKASPDTRVVVVTDQGSLDGAIRAMREGTVDGLLRCFSIERLDHLVRKVVEIYPNRGHVQRPIITTCPKMRQVLDSAEKVADSTATVLISGETGTGKELLARHIHVRSRRRFRPFVAVNCAALPEALMESELFGHEKGAFTGATDRKPGKFEVAQGGTILLDEVGEMNAVAQAKLLRVLQEREVDRVGGREPIPIDVRVIATTNRDLKREAVGGRFREDLFYRLNVFPLTLPPLRDRKEDLPGLLEHFIKKHCASNGRETMRMHDKALGLLMERRWEGNVRELENMTEKAVLIASGDTLLPEHFEFGDAPEAAPDGSFKDMERALITATLEETGGNKTLAARKLGVSVRTVRNKLKLYENSSR